MLQQPNSIVLGVRDLLDFHIKGRSELVVEWDQRHSVQNYYLVVLLLFYIKCLFLNKTRTKLK
jgi:hypothetical protein